jgi:hypothetical protein
VKLIKKTGNSKIFAQNKNQIWKIRETIMIYNFRETQNPSIESNEIADLRLNDSDHIDDTINIESAITTFQYLKLRYFKNNQYHITINSCLRGPVVSWIDYQRNHTEIRESLEHNIMEEEEQNYWNSRPSVGSIFEGSV